MNNNLSKLAILSFIYRVLIPFKSSLLVMLILLVFRWFMLSQWESQMQGQAEMFSYIKLTLNFVTGFWLIVTGTALLSALNTWYLIQKKRQERDLANFKDFDSPDIATEL
jgi:hypothetical protein